ncbi:MAG TPA: CHRD domain-containing protein [Burkholderiaceae bacterium]|nr:CHRD domain-containing protein [Burkholderiaceae bacterium]
MNAIFQKPHHMLAMLVIAASAFTAGAGLAAAADVKVALTGGHEVPPVTTKASGQGTLSINADKSVSGSIVTSGVEGTMAHIHEAAAGKNGPIIVPLEKQGDRWAVPAGAKLTDAQYKAFQNGDLYVNVHSAAHPGGEIRAQLKP